MDILPQHELYLAKIKAQYETIENLQKELEEVKSQLAMEGEERSRTSTKTNHHGTLVSRVSMSPGNRPELLWLCYVHRAFLWWSGHVWIGSQRVLWRILPFLFGSRAGDRPDRMPSDWTSICHKKPSKVQKVQCDTRHNTMRRSRYFLLRLESPTSTFFAAQPPFLPNTLDWMTAALLNLDDPPTSLLCQTQTGSVVTWSHWASLACHYSARKHLHCIGRSRVRCM